MTEPNTFKELVVRARDIQAAKHAIEEFIRNADIEAVERLLRQILGKETYRDRKIEISDRERIAFLTRVLSASLRRDDAERIWGFLTRMINENRGKIAADSIMFTQS